MGFFAGYYTKEGPGVPKELPPKQGIRLFADVLFREFWELTGLNILTIIFLLPGFTMGAALTAHNYIILKMVRDEVVDMPGEFIETFIGNIKKTWIFSIVFAAGCAVYVIAVLFYLNLAIQNRAWLALVILLVNILIYVSAALPWLFLGLAQGVRVIECVKISLKMPLKAGARSLGVSSAVIGATIICVIFFPFNLPFLVLWACSAVTLICQVILRPVIEKMNFKNPVTIKV